MNLEIASMIKVSAAYHRNSSVLNDWLVSR